MNNRLSHSSLTMYSDCSERYRLHYKEKLRSITQASPLLFGSAVDKALEYALKNFDEVTERQVKVIFLKHWRYAEINGQKTYLRTSELVKYNKSDIDPLLSDNAWASLKFKGLLMVEAYFRDIAPLIRGVVSSQEEIALTNDNGDAITGFVDAVLQWPSVKFPIIFDFKTSGRPYKQSQVKESPQLTLYKHALGEKYKTNKVGFIVFIKQLDKGILKICKSCEFDGSNTRHSTCNNIVGKKRCGGEFTVTYKPFVKTQVLIDEVDSEFEEKTLDNFDKFNSLVQTETYEKNLNACHGIFGACLYYESCHNGSTEGLIKK